MIFAADMRKDESGIERENIYFSFGHGVSQGVTRSYLVKIEPVFNGQVLPYTCTATPGVLTMETIQGKMEICFDGGETVLFRTNKGVGVHFTMFYEPHDLFLDRLDGTVHTHYKLIGEFLFECTHGKLRHNGFWIGSKMTPMTNYVDYLPGEDGKAEGYIHYAPNSVNRPVKLNDFDKAVQDSRADYEDWCKKYPEVPEKYAEAWRTAIYAVWICYAAPHGAMKGGIMYMQKSGPFCRAMAWHQGYHAMTVCRADLDTAVQLLYSIFGYQDEYGQVPDSVNDIYWDMHCTKPPFQGFAFDYIVSHAGFDKFTREHCEKLYVPFCRWIDWWRNFRDADGNGLIDYSHADESGWDDGSMFSKGTPVETPDISAFLVLLMEAVSKMAGKLGKKDEAEKWLADSKVMFDDMIKTFWNGEKFVGRIAKTHETVDVESIAMYQPIILGKRLPEEIIEKIAARISRPDFLTDEGLASESKNSPYYAMGSSFMLGRVVGPVQLMLAIGLFNAGKKELAGKIAAAWCDFVLGYGLVNMRRDSLVLDDPASIVPPLVPGSGWGSWSSAIFILLARLLKEV
ncbi:MAG: hypothetical protein LBD71_03050 [Treponema sp.]|jgi:hypothetical protein|nr:hypothetical protein [Treponema sp.]